MKTRTTLLLNWYANPYHAPVLAAKALGFYDDEDIKLAILEPTDPSDVTEIVGLGNVDIGLKAMVHCYAAKNRGYPIKSIGTLLDEPSTGLIYLKKSGIQSFDDIRGKRLGYVGEFGKIMIDDLAKCAGITDYETVRVGMNIVDAIRRDVVDAGIGIGCFQQVELEHEMGEAGMLRIDQLAGLGCCCFCSIMFIAHEKVLQEQPEMLQRFLSATQRGAALVADNPDRAFEVIQEYYPRLDSELYKKVFNRSLPFFSRNLLNVERDWDKVGNYSVRLGIADKGFSICDYFTNEFVPSTPFSEVKPLGCSV